MLKSIWKLCAYISLFCTFCDFVDVWNGSVGLLECSNRIRSLRFPTISVSAALAASSPSSSELIVCVCSTVCPPPVV